MIETLSSALLKWDAQLSLFSVAQSDLHYMYQSLED